ncbi:MAG: response regulator [Rhizobacter sp.]
MFYVIARGRMAALLNPLEQLAQRMLNDDELGLEGEVITAPHSLEEAVLKRGVQKMALTERKQTRDIAHAYSQWNLALIGTMARMHNREEMTQACSAARLELWNTIDHELRQPLSAIKNMSGWLSDSGLLPHQAEQAKTSMSCADMLLEFLDDTAASLTPAQRHSTPCDKPVPFNLGETLEDCVAIFHSSAKILGVELSCRIDADFPNSVTAQPVKFRRVISALLTQALSVTSQKTLKVRLRSSGAVDDGNRRLSISIRDLDCPASPDSTASLTMDGSEPTGPQASINDLNALVGEWVLALGGTLTASSLSDQGVAIRLELPLVGEPSAARPEAPTRMLPQADTAWRVLVAEDNAAALIVLRHYLNDFNVVVTVVSDGSQAWLAMNRAHFNGSPFDLVIAKSNLAKIDGVTLANRLAQDEKLRQHTRIALLASMDEIPPSDQHVAVCAWIPKPIRRSTLKAALSNVLESNLTWRSPTAKNPRPTQRLESSRWLAQQFV